MYLADSQDAELVLVGHARQRGGDSCEMLTIIAGLARTVAVMPGTDSTSCLGRAWWRTRMVVWLSWHRLVTAT